MCVREGSKHYDGKKQCGAKEGRIRSCSKGEAHELQMDRSIVIRARAICDCFLQSLFRIDGGCRFKVRNESVNERGASCAG